MPRASSRFLRWVGVFGAVFAVPAWGQEPAAESVRVQGVVIDAATYEPVDSATVTLVGGSTHVTTERAGVFEIEAPAGPASLHVTAPGHSSVVVDLDVYADRPVYVRVVLPSFAVTLSELLVQAEGDPSTPAARTAADLLAAEVPRTRVNSGQVGQSNFQLNLRLATTLTGPQAPTIVVDGVVLSRGAAAFEALDRIPAADVEEIEVLRGPVAAFLYPFAANGVILVTTKRGKEP
jgi:outer membrane receptor protein involved in Fe transport